MVSTSTCRVCVFLLALLLSAVVVAYSLYLTWRPTADQTATNTTGSRAVESLKYVVVVARHGNRRLYTYPNDPYPPSNKTLWPYSLGALTVKGRNEMYNLGVKIRTLYNGFLDQYYSGDKFYASSTPYERVMMSGQAFVAGLFPPLGYEIWDKNILWQPIPVYDDSPDKLPVADAGTCPRLNQARTLSISQTIEEYQANYTEVNDYLMPYTGSNVSGFSGVYYVFDASIAEEFEEYPLPEWLLEVYPAPMTELVGEVYIGLNAANDLEVRLIIGPLIQQMMGLMQSKANGTLTPDRQMHFYSGHDTSLITLQGTLGIAKSSMIGLVKPASAMLFELHQDPDSGQFYVQVLYIDGGSEDLDPFPFDIPNCGESCDFDQLVNITSKFCNITDYWAECQFNYTSEATLSL